MVKIGLLLGGAIGFHVVSVFSELVDFHDVWMVQGHEDLAFVDDGLQIRIMVGRIVDDLDGIVLAIGFVHGKLDPSIREFLL